MGLFLVVNRLREPAAHEDVRSVIEDHVIWARGLLREGKLMQVGKWGGRSGIAILEAFDLEHARMLLASDPLARAGFVEQEVGELHLL